MNEITKITKAKTKFKTGDKVYTWHNNKIIALKVDNISMDMWGTVIIRAKSKNNIIVGGEFIFGLTKKEVGAPIIPIIKEKIERNKRELRKLEQELIYIERTI